MSEWDAGKYGIDWKSAILNANKLITNGIGMIQRPLTMNINSFECQVTFELTLRCLLVTQVQLVHLKGDYGIKDLWHASQPSINYVLINFNI